MYLGVESVFAEYGAHNADFGLSRLEHMVLVHDHAGKPRGSQRHVEVLGKIRENGTEPVL